MNFTTSFVPVLRDQGFRFVYRKGAFLWAHPTTLLADDVDCTDMTDEEFELFVVRHVDCC